MTGHPLLRFSIFGLLLFVWSACAAEPIAREYRKEAKAEDLTFSMVFQNPDAYIGAIVLWGGIIIETTVANGGTQIIALETPLGLGERPESAAHSQGRFIAMSSKLLEPAIYNPGRKITLAGQVAGKKTLPLGETTYTYPVVTVKQLHRWLKRPSYLNPYAYPFDYHYWGWGPYWIWEPPDEYGEGLD